MALDVNHFARLRPYLFHLTGRANIQNIQHELLLKSTNALYAESGENHLRGIRRPAHTTLKSGRQIRDQQPLYAGKITFSGNWNLTDLVLHLDDHVFFWPGWEGGPVTSGQNHFKRYTGEHPIILRVTTTALIMENPGVLPHFCKYNSGAPRCTYGKGSPRGPRTFLSAADFPFSATDVREVVFKSEVKLPSTVQALIYPNSNWQPLKTFSLHSL